MGRACVTPKGDGSICWRKWIDIRNVTLADAGKPGISHVDPSNIREINEIMAEAAREDAVYAEATRIAAGFGIGGMAPGSEQAAEIAPDMMEW